MYLSFGWRWIFLGTSGLFNVCRRWAGYAPIKLSCVTSYATSLRQCSHQLYFSISTLLGSPDFDHHHLCFFTDLSDAAAFDVHARFMYASPPPHISRLRYPIEGESIMFLISRLVFGTYAEKNYSSDVTKVEQPRSCSEPLEKADNLRALFLINGARWLALVPLI